MDSKNKLFSDHEQGSARFAEAEEIRQATTKVNLLEDDCTCGGLPLYSNGADEIWVDGKDTNSLIVSTTGGGKSRRVCTPLLLSDIAAGNTIIVTDPKAELLKSTYEFLKKHEYNIKVINFRDPQNSNHWNPLYRGACLYKTRPDLAAEAFCEVGHSIYQGVHSEKDPFWEIAAENIFAGFAMLLSEHCKAEEVTLGTVYRTFIDGSKKLGGTTYIKEYVSNSSNPLIEQALSGYIGAPNETRASIDSVFASQLSKLVINRSIDEMLTGKSFQAKDFVDEKTALFICIRDESSTYSTIVSLLINELYITLVEYAEKNGGKLPRTVDFVLDEFCNFPKIPEFSNRISACRSRGIRFYLFIQSLYQLNSVYGEDVAQIILNNSDNWMILQARDMKILRQFSERCGDVYGMYSQEKRPLLPAAAIQHLSKRDGETLTLFGAEHPFISELPDRSLYMENLGLKELSEIPQIDDVFEKTTEEFSICKYVEYLRDKKVKELLDVKTDEKNPKDKSSIMAQALFGEDDDVKKNSKQSTDQSLDQQMMDLINMTPGGISIEDVVKKIDEKIAELEEEERKEKEEKKRKENGESEDGTNSTSDSEPLPFCG